MTNNLLPIELYDYVSLIEQQSLIQSYFGSAYLSLDYKQLIIIFKNNKFYLSNFTFLEIRVVSIKRSHKILKLYQYLI